MKNFYNPEQISSKYNQIAPVYQKAFKGSPWYEVSKCPDEIQRCIGGLSAVAVGSLCETCNIKPTRPAYEVDELIKKFEYLGESRPTVWYMDQSDSKLALAAFAWKSTADSIVAEKYAENPSMRSWMNNEFGETSIGWLDEVFADLGVRSSGNLNNFKDMCLGFGEQLGVDVLAYRTKNPRMLAAARRDFGISDLENRTVPDAREFVILSLANQTGQIMSGRKEI